MHRTERVARFPAPVGAFLGGLFSLALVSCYHPDYAAAGYLCGPDAGDAGCPAGLSCIGGTCVVSSPDQRPSGDQGPAIDQGMADLSGPPRPDLRVMTDLLRTPDLRRSPDLRHNPDLLPPPPDLSQPTPDLMKGPCTNSGLAVDMDESVYACNGTFGGIIAPGQLCGPGFHLCGNKDMALLMTVKASDCHAPDGSGGFYAVDIKAQKTTMNGQTAVACPPPMMMKPDSLVGCGSESGTLGTVNNCDGLMTIYHCGDPSGSWSCMKSLEDASHSKPVGGVLCCKG